MTLSSGAVAGISTTIAVVVVAVVVYFVYFKKTDADKEVTCDLTMFKTDYNDTCLNCDDTCMQRSSTSTALSCVPNRYPVCDAWTTEDGFECVEGEWVLLETSAGGVDSLVGSYYILRDPSSDNVGKYDVINMDGTGSGAYLLSDATIALTDVSKNGNGQFAFTLTGAAADSGTEMDNAITIPTYFQGGSIPANCLPPIYGTDEWATNRANGSFTIYTFTESDDHTLTLAKSGNFGSNCICDENQYTYGCSLFEDAVCTDCSGCGAGHYMKTACYVDVLGTYQPTECAECAFGLQSKAKTTDPDVYTCTYMDEDPNYATACKTCGQSCIYMSTDGGCSDPDTTTCTLTHESTCVNTSGTLVCRSGYYYLYDASGIVQSGPYLINPHATINNRFNFTYRGKIDADKYLIANTTMGLGNQTWFRNFTLYLNGVVVVPNIANSPPLQWTGDACDTEVLSDWNATTCDGCTQGRLSIYGTDPAASTYIANGMYLEAQRSSCAIGTYNLYSAHGNYMSGPYAITNNFTIMFQFNLEYQGLLDDSTSQVLLSAAGNTISQILIENSDTLGVTGRLVDCSIYKNFGKTQIEALSDTDLLITLSCEKIKCTPTQCSNAQLTISASDRISNKMYLYKI